MLLSSDGSVLGEWACQGRHPRDRIKTFTEIKVRLDETGPAVVAIEDVFPAASRTLSYKEAVRHQGALDLMFFAFAPGYADIQWVMPTTWQRALGYPYHRPKKERPSTKRWAKDKCAEHGYTPPDWARGSKALEDLRDGFLIALYQLQARLKLHIPETMQFRRPSG